MAPWPLWLVSMILVSCLAGKHDGHLALAVGITVSPSLSEHSPSLLGFKQYTKTFACALFLGMACALMEVSERHMRNVWVYVTQGSC